MEEMIAKGLPASWVYAEIMSMKSMKRKICIVTAEYPSESWGGLGRTVFRVSHHAMDMGHDVHVAVLKIKPDSRVLLDENRKTRVSKGMKIHEIEVGQEGLTFGQKTLWDCAHSLTIRMMYQSLEMLHREELFEMFHSFYLIPLGYISGLLAKRLQKPHIVTIVGNDVKKYVFSPENVALCRSALENANRVVGLSQDLIDMADSLLPIRHKAKIILNSVNIPEKAWQPRQKTNGVFKIGTAGIFKYDKGLPYLLKAINALLLNYSVYLELLGEFEESERGLLERLIDELSLRETVKFKNAIPHQEIPEWLRTLDVFVLPSVSEGCPNIVMEAMASGVPSIATRTGAMEELIKNEESGLLVPWGKSEALKEAIDRLLGDEVFARTIGIKGRKRMKRFDSRREFESWQALYLEIMKEVPES